jgi:hypothetical protein
MRERSTIPGTHSLTIEPVPEFGYSRPANGQRALTISPRGERPLDAEGFGRSRNASAPDAPDQRPVGRYGVADDASQTFMPVPRSKASTVTRRDTRPVIPRRAARGSYRPSHRPAEDTVDLVAQRRVHEPPSWLLSGTLMALAVISLLATSVWLAYHYAQTWPR